MTLAIALSLNVALMVALLAGLAYVMSRPRKLAPHVQTGAVGPRRMEPRRAQAPRSTRTPAALAA